MPPTDIDIAMGRKPMSIADTERPRITSILRTTPASSVRAYVTRTLPDTSPIVVSNRAPYEPGTDGGFKRGAGGVITGLLTLADAMGADWVACARTDTERSLAAKVAGPLTVPLLQSTGNLHYVSPTREQYEMYYAVFANPVLWFIQHYLWDLANEPVIDERIHQAWRDGYVEVNRQIAARVVDVGRAAPKRPLVLVHDYQLYLVPRLVRQSLPSAMIQHFVHVPWPTPQYWKILPKPMRDAILEGLLGCDVVGFQSSLDVRNFLLTCEENMGLQVDERERAVLFGGRVVYARHYRISIDVPATSRLAARSGSSRRSQRGDRRSSSCASTAPTRPRTSFADSSPTTSCCDTIPSFGARCSSGPFFSRRARTSRFTAGMCGRSGKSWAASTASSEPTRGCRSAWRSVRASGKRWRRFGTSTCCSSIPSTTA